MSLDTSIEGLKALKAGNVPSSVIKVIIDPAAPVLTGTTLSAAATPVADRNIPPQEIGVYWKDGTNFVMIQGQALTNLKAGGKIGSMATYGLRNQHWDAFVDGPSSKNVVKERRPIFYLYVADGTDSSDYGLIGLITKGDRREFQVGSFGGLTGGRSGLKKDKKIPFKAERVGIRTYRLTLDSEFKPGEYAFFMGTGETNTMAGAHGGNRSGGAATGRIFDFKISQ